MSIKAKILFISVIIILALAAAILFSNIMLFSSFVDRAAVERVDSATRVVMRGLDALKAETRAVALSLARDPDLAAATAGQRREELLARMASLLLETGGEFCTVTDAQSRVIARTHEPERFGDSLLFQSNIRSALAGKTLATVEAGTTVRLSARASAPVYDAHGALAGAVSVGYRLDTDSFVEAQKAATDCEITLVLGDERVSSTVRGEDGASAVGTKADPQIAETVLAGNSYSGRIDVMGRTAVARYTPLDGPDGRPIGMIFVGRYLAEEAKTTTTFVREGIWITLAMMAASITVLLLVIGRIVKPVRAMTRAAAALAAGDTDIDIEVAAKDEMGALAEAFNSMISNTRRQVRAVESIAGGDLTAALVPRSDKDVMNSALVRLQEKLKAQAAAIREEHNRIQIMLDATPLASRLWNKDFTIIDCNEAAVKLFNLKDKREYMERYFELSPQYQPDGRTTREKGFAVVREAYEKGRCDCDWMYQMPDGTPVPCELTLVRVPYGDDFAVAAYSRDLREQKKMMNDIEQRDKLLQTVNQAADILLHSELDEFSADIHRCMGMMAVAIDADRMYVWKNHLLNGELHCTQVYEWSENVRPFQGSDETIDLSYDENVPDFKTVYLRGECVNALTRDVPPASRKVFESKGVLSVLALPIFIRGEFWGFVGFEDCRNERLFTENEESVMHSGSLLIVNAILRHEQVLNIRDTSAQLEVALTDAREANRAKSAFLAQMSHEIRTPLNAVVGLSELALDAEDLGDEMATKMEKIRVSGLTILSIVNDILDISKIEAGKFELLPTEYDTPSLINDITTLNVVRIGEKPIAFKLAVDEHLPGVLYGDDLRVKQIFNNLLSNAFKYTHSGEVEWRLSHEREGEDVWLVSSIRDTGIGIKPEDLRGIFAEYNQVDMQANRKVEGAGLGLPITRRLLKMMDGSITVESEYGQGTTFHVRLRQRFIAGAPIGREVAENLMGLRYMLSKRGRRTKLNRVNLSYAHVLLVDDIQTNLDVVKGMMTPYSLNIDCAMSGPQAIAMIRAGEPRYSAVFMDHMMPVMDGLEATRVIREEIGTEYAKNIPVIALTANAIVGNEEMFLNGGFQDFISKPIDTAKLDSVLRRWVRDKSLEHEPDEGEEPSTPDGAESESLLGKLVSDGLDVAGALKRFNGDEVTLMTVLRSYTAGTRLLLLSLNEYLTAEKLKDYAIIVHGIKGSSHSLCAREVGALAEKLEKAAKAGDLEAVMAGHGTFEKTTEKLLAAIDGALGGIEAAGDKPLAEAPDQELLLELREAARAFDMDRVDAAMAGLEALRYENESGEELVAWLREQVDNMAFEKIFNSSFTELQPSAGMARTTLSFTAPGAEILIVDDNETNLAAAKGLLKPLEMRLDTAQSGEEALHRISGKQYHLIFMDHLMPGMDGLETTERLRRLEGYESIPVIALTADEALSAREIFLAAGLNDFIAKPIDMEEITAKLRHWLPGELLQAAAPRDGSGRPPEAPADQVELPAIDGINPVDGLRHSGSKMLFVSLLGYFYQVIDLKSTQIEDHLAKGLFRDLAIEAHALKNSSRMIGAGELAKGFGRLEQYGNENDAESLERETPEVLRQYRAFKSRLAPFGETAEEDKREATGEELISILRQLRAAMAAFDLDTADEAMKHLEGLRTPNECRTEIETLRAYVADVALEEIMELTETMLQTIEGAIGENRV